eukprot:7503807-Pyramimonas_sp.AAC.1
MDEKSYVSSGCVFSTSHARTEVLTKAQLLTKLVSQRASLERKHVIRHTRDACTTPPRCFSAPQHARRSISLEDRI